MSVDARIKELEAAFARFKESSEYSTVVWMAGEDLDAALYFMFVKGILWQLEEIKLMHEVKLLQDNGLGEV